MSATEPLWCDNKAWALVPWKAKAPTSPTLTSSQANELDWRAKIDTLALAIREHAQNMMVQMTQVTDCTGGLVHHIACKLHHARHTGCTFCMPNITFDTRHVDRELLRLLASESNTVEAAPTSMGSPRGVPVPCICKTCTFQASSSEACKSHAHHLLL